MNKALIISNAQIVNEGKIFHGALLIRDGIIAEIYHGNENVNTEIAAEAEIIDAAGKFLIPGVIDDQVHFREPGLTHKAEIYTESKAAVAGGFACRRCIGARPYCR